MNYFSEDTIKRALVQLHATAGHMLKIWFVLKRMGLVVGGDAIRVDTSNSTPALTDLFSSGAQDGTYFVPFGHSPRFKEMKHDAARSIIQTNIRRWASSDSVVGCDPTAFLSFSESQDGQLLVKCTNNYPLGLGYGGDGFAIGNNQVVRIPWLAWVVWYCRQRDLGSDSNSIEDAEELVVQELGLTHVERQLLFVATELEYHFQDLPISDQSLWSLCQSSRSLDETAITELGEVPNFAKYSRKVRAMVPNLGQPTWLRPNSDDDFKEAIERGEVSILLYGPPRTGKTRTIDELVPRSDPKRATIQLHDGWSYDQLIQGILPTSDGGWDWRSGPLLSALRSGKKFIVLEEANRTSLVQALGEVFSLLERRYRGKENSITLRSGDEFWIDEDVVFILTANNLDKSTEDLDDALLGRMCVIECPPNSDQLTTMLIERSLEESKVQAVVDVFMAVQEVYPLGHGYFADFDSNTTGKMARNTYKTRIRPVVLNFVGPALASSLSTIDVMVDEKFNW